MNPPEVTPSELNLELNSPHPPLLLDVRESDELEISALPNIVHIPMNDLPHRFDELDREANIVVVCRTGNRSGKITAFLLGQGFERVRNLTAGMNGWATEVDPNVKQY